MPRVVLDTNILVSALFFGRAQWNWLRDAWKAGILIPVVCAATTMELIRVLKYPKFQLDESEQEALLAEFLPFCETKSNPSEVPELPPCRDPADQIFLELAYSSGADYLVSGDNDLLEYPALTTVKILSPSDLKTLLFER